ncbi:MAG: phosphopyruvate hydratase, partial [Candidatus Woesearchaeota archaeon]|nr:phosphopyruvate hydratase [Candidatus Woesearchaeota archaeon]
DEGGFAPSKLKRMEDRFDIMLKAVKKAGYEGKMQIGIDAAASEFYYKDYYVLEGKKYSADKLIKHYEKLAKDFPLVSLEDGMSQDDWGHWKTMNAHLGKSMQLVGDDLFVTNSDRIREGILEGAANAVLIKVNQIGTVTETLEAMKLGHEVGWSSIVSHRSGETEDHFIADLVVGTNDGQCKFGAPARSDRNAKYNQLLRIEEDLGSKAKYPGKNFRTVGL